VPFNQKRAANGCRSEQHYLARAEILRLEQVGWKTVLAHERNGILASLPPSAALSGIPGLPMI
jgi:hypothetical protein